ncbi:hypothetical protein Tco_0584530, partial [Tanacetum coccineum]
MRKEKEKKKKDRRKDEEKETKKERKERKKETNVMLFGEERRFMGAGAERGSCLMTLYIELLGLMGIPRSWNMWVCCVWGVPAGLWIGEQAYEIGFLWILGRSGERVVRGGMGCGRLVGCVRGCGLLELWDGVLVVGCGEVIVTGCNGGWWCGRWDTWVGDCWGVLMWCKVAVVGGWSGSVWGAGGGEGTCGLWLAGGWFGCEVLLGCGAGCCWGGGAGRDSGMVVWDGGGGAMRQGCGVEIWWGMGDTVALWGGVAGLWLAGLVIGGMEVRAWAWEGASFWVLEGVMVGCFLVCVWGCGGLWVCRATAARSGLGGVGCLVPGAMRVYGGGRLGGVLGLRWSIDIRHWIAICRLPEPVNFSLCKNVAILRYMAKLEVLTNLYDLFRRTLAIDDGLPLSLRFRAHKTKVTFPSLLSESRDATWFLRSLFSFSPGDLIGLRYSIGWAYASTRIRQRQFKVPVGNMLLLFYFGPIIAMGEYLIGFRVKPAYKATCSSDYHERDPVRTGVLLVLEFNDGVLAQNCAPSIAAEANLGYYFK